MIQRTNVAAGDYVQLLAINYFRFQDVATRRRISASLGIAE